MPAVADQQIRILRSRSTDGDMAYSVDNTGLPLITSWVLLPDLRQLNVLLYFALHPHIYEIWCELLHTEVVAESTDASTNPSRMYTVATSDSSVSDSVASARPVQGAPVRPVAPVADIPFEPAYALVIRRSDLRSSLVTDLAAHQRTYWTTRFQPLPPAHHFVGTLHGL